MWSVAVFHKDDKVLGHIINKKRNKTTNFSVKLFGLKTGQNRRFLKGVKIADSENKTKPPICNNKDCQFCQSL